MFARRHFKLMIKNQSIAYKMAASILVLGGFILFSWIFINTTAAQESTGQGLEISPPVLILTANPGETVRTRVLVRNVTSTDLIVTGETNDFVAAGEDGTPKVLLDESETSPYSIKDWITIPGRVTLVPREIKTMEINIRVPQDASPGGHYGVVRFTGTPPNLEGQGVALTASLGSLILLSVSGDITHNLTVEEFAAQKDGKNASIFESLPFQLAARIKNDGNVHERPGGAVTITNMFGKTVATFPYNPGARHILPASTRKFEQALDKSIVGNARFFGKYTAKLTVIYGEGNQKTTTSTVTFWVIPWKLILAVIGGLVAAFFVIRYAIRRYNRYIISRTNSRR